jgi:hypothetical protein
MAATVLAWIGPPDPKVVPALLGGDGAGAGAGDGAGPGAGPAGARPAVWDPECGAGPAGAGGASAFAGAVAVARPTAGRPFVAPVIALLPGGVVAAAVA